MKAFVFSCKDLPGPIAVGVGQDSLQARADALNRTIARYKSLEKNGDFSATLAGKFLSRLRLGEVGLVKELDASVVGRQMGHDYINDETMQVAAVLGSWEEAHKCAHGAFLKGGESAAIEALKSDFPHVVRSEGVDPALVDWLEVLDSVYERPQQHEAQADAPQEAGALRRIDADVLDVLRGCTVDGNHLRLPPGRMDRKLYERVNEVLVALGGKWVGRKVQAHVFEEDPASMLDVAVSTGLFLKPQDVGYFPTPDDVVERVLALADLQPGMKALEPSAGRGAIAIKMAQVLGFDRVTVVELLHGNARKLVEAGFSAVNRVDFLSIDPVPIYDRIVMNPPFSRLADIEHVMHAARFLKPDGKLVAITAPSWGFNSARKAEQFRDFVAECEGHVEEVPAGSFKESGTGIATRIVAMDAKNFPWNRDIPVVSERMRA
jgi:protein-L-isoaspartate O-methyltransferase